MQRFLKRWKMAHAYYKTTN